jgi:hypothetical protein
MKCRHCGTQLEHTFLDLGFAPPSNAYLKAADLTRPEKYYPLKVRVCDKCWLVQTEDYAQADELFNADYAYFSSTSTTWLAHAKLYADKMTQLLGLGKSHLVIEIASNDGYLLKNFVDAGIPCLGIEPTASTAKAAEDLGIPVLREFFGETLGKQFAAQGRLADLIVGNNVYAHVPDINDFTRGLKAALKADGTVTLEFPHLLRLIEFNQFDTIYHEHFSYLSLTIVSRIFSGSGLRVWDVQELPTHGGSLRIFGCHADDSRKTSAAVAAMLDLERDRGLQQIETYTAFQRKADKVKDDLLIFLLERKRLGEKVVGYGAAAKGNTLLNYAGIKPDLLPFIVDAASSKQGKFMPGSHIRILPRDQMERAQPMYVLILPWNISQEVVSQYRDLDVSFVTAVPELRISKPNLD